MDVESILRQRQEVIKSTLRVSRESFRKKILERIHNGEEIYKRNVRTTAQFDEAEQDFNEWDEYNSRLLEESFTSKENSFKQHYDTANTFYTLVSSSQLNEVQEFKEEVLKKINSLEQLVSQIDFMESEVPDVDKKVNPPLKSISSKPESNNYVFVALGNNEEEQVEVLMTLEKLGLVPIVVSELSDSGFDINDMMSRYEDINYAIVLLTGDDLAKKESSDRFLRRADQRNILELGYFIGKLGRGKVFPLYTKGLEIPLDQFGLFYIEMDSNSFWKFRLAKELKAAGYEIDANNII